MSEKRNPFEVFKKFTRFNNELLQELADADWDDPTEALKFFSEDRWPPVDLIEFQDEISVLIEIPDLQKASDINIRLKGNVLQLEGEKTEPFVVQNARVHKQERRRGSFNRSITLPAAVNGKFARVTYKKGILEVKLTKVPESQVETLRIDF